MLRVAYIGIRLQKESPALSTQHVFLDSCCGISGDLLGDDPDKQISIIIKRLGKSIVKSDDSGFCIARFKPNLILETTDSSDVSVKDSLEVGFCELEITIAGKKCHVDCPLFRNEQSCGYNKDIFFAKVVKGGEIRLNDEANVRRYSDK